MATLNELLNEFGLAEAPAQTKTASQAKPTNEQVNKVLEDLGFAGDDESTAALESMTKAANDKGDSTMSTSFLSDYEAIFGDHEAPAAASVEDGVSKEASEAGEGEGSESNSFGELVGTYFNAMKEGFIEKTAGDLEAEAGAGHNPEPEHTTGSLTATIGQKGNPRLPVNRKAGEPLHVMTGNTSPYSLKGALAKQVLKRVGTSAPGDVGAYKE